MKRKAVGTLARLCLVTGMALAALGAAAPEDGERAPGSYVVVCPIEDMIDDGTLVLVERALREAKDAAAIIFSIDTPGGRVDSAIEVTERIVGSPIRSIAFIHGMGAISAGALISYSCDDMVMAPGSNIGASAVVMMGPEGMSPAGEKATSAVRAKYRSLAEANGHNADIGEAMVDEDIELRAARGEDGKLIVWASDKGPPTEAADAEPAEDAMTPEEAEAKKSVIEQVLEAVDEKVPLPDELKEGIRQLGQPQEPGETPSLRAGEDPAGRVVLPKGKLLTLSLKEAVEWGVVTSQAANPSDAMHVFGYSELARVNITPTWSEELFKWLIHPTVSGLLLLLGMGGLYVEVRTPGFGVPGIMGLTCLGLFFGARMVVGLADWLDLALVILGVALILVEVFVLPGFGFVGAGGFIALIAGIYLSFTRVVIPEMPWEWDRVAESGLALTLMGLGLFFFVMISARYFASSPLGRRLTLATEIGADAGYVVQGAEEQAMVGQTGVAISRLNPTGRGRFDGKTRQVVCRGDFIEEGTAIRIFRVEGNRLVVDAVRERES